MINNDISLILTSSSSHENVNLKVKFMHNGQELGGKYAISAKKINPFIYKQSKEHAKLSEKYFWTPLKLKSSDGDETWVKILKSDLKQHFEIEDDELTKVRDGIELENLIKAHLNKLLKEEGSGLPKSENIEETNSLYRNVIKFFLCHFVVYPSVKKVIREALENKGSLELADIYVKNREALLVHVKVHLADKNESALEFFGSEMISRVIDETLIKETNYLLTKQKEIPWSDHKVEILNQLRLIEFFANNPDEILNEEVLKKVDPILIPISKLATIPVTDANLKVLTGLWKLVTEDLYAKGKLNIFSLTNDKKETTLQSHYAGLYLEAYHLMPKKVKKTLGFDKGEIEKITNFALQHSFLGEGVLQNEQKIYSEKIQPIIQKALEKYTSSSDVSDLLEVYTRVAGKKFEIYNLNRAIAKVLEPDDKKYFDHYTRDALIFNEIEKIAVLKYNLTSTQLKNLIEYKEAYNNKMREYDDFSYRMENAKSRSAVFDLLNFSKLLGSNSKAVENILPSAFPELEEGYATSPLTDLDRVLAVQRLEKAGEQIERVQQPYSDGLANEELQSILDNEISKGREYLKEMRGRDEAYLRYNKYFNRENEHIAKMIYNEEIKQEVLSGQNSPLFSADQQVNLMELEVELNKSKLNNILEVRKLENNGLQRTEGKRILDFLESAKKDPKFIKSLEMSLGRDDKKSFSSIPSGISKDTLNFVLEYTLRTEKMEELTKSLDKALFKADHLLKSYNEDPSLIAKDERLSLKELGVISSAERLSANRYESEGKKRRFSQELKSLGLVDLNEKLSDFATKGEKSNLILETLNEISQKAINEHYEASDIFAYNGVKKEKWQDKSSDTMQKLTMFVANDLTHGGKLYRKDGNIQTSHLLGRVVNREFNFYEICVSDVWKLDLKPLVPKSMEDHLQMILGDNWVDEINKMHQSIENDLQFNSRSKFEKVKNDSNRRNLAGVANYGAFLKFINKDLKGHERDFDRDFNKLHDKFFNDEKFEEKQICSEFASKITLVSIIELNRRLSEKLLEKFGDRFDSKNILDVIMGDGAEVSEDVQAYANGVRHFGKDSKITKEAEKGWRKLLAKRGYKDSDIELAIRVGNKEILDLPYSKKERMRAIHPGRMVSLLVDKKCAVKRQLPPVIQTLLDID